MIGFDKMYSFLVKLVMGFNILCNKKWFVMFGKIKFCFVFRNIVSKMLINGLDYVIEK